MRSNGAAELGSGSRRIRMPDSGASAFLFVASCRLSNQFALPGKRYGVSEELFGAWRKRNSCTRDSGGARR